MVLDFTAIGFNSLFATQKSHLTKIFKSKFKKMTILFWIHKSQINKKGTAPIRMRITINKERAEVNTDISVYSESWDSIKQRIIEASIPDKENNNTLLHFTGLALGYYNDCLRRNISPTANLIRDMILKKHQPTYTLLQAMNGHISNLKARVGYDISENTLKKNKTVENKVRLFLQQKMNRQDIGLSELNGKFINELDLYACAD